MKALICIFHPRDRMLLIPHGSMGCRPLHSLPSSTFSFTWQFPGSCYPVLNAWTGRDECGSPKWTQAVPLLEQKMLFLRLRKKWEGSLCSQVALFLSSTPEHLTSSSSYSWVVRNHHSASGLLNSHSLSPLKALELWKPHLTFSWEVKTLGCFRGVRIDSLLAKLSSGPSCLSLRKGTSEVRWRQVCPKNWKAVTLIKGELSKLGL